MNFYTAHFSSALMPIELKACFLGKNIDPCRLQPTLDCKCILKAQTKKFLNKTWGLNPRINYTMKMQRSLGHFCIWNKKPENLKE